MTDKQGDMPEGVKTEFPYHPVIIGVDLATPDGDKSVACVEYSEYQKLQRKADMAEMLCRTLEDVIHGVESQWPCARAAIAQFREGK